MEIIDVWVVHVQVTNWLTSERSYVYPPIWRLFTVSYANIYIRLRKREKSYEKSQRHVENTRLPWTTQRDDFTRNRSQYVV